MGFGHLWSYNWAVLGLRVFFVGDFGFNNCSYFVVDAVFGDAGIGKGVRSLCLLGVSRGGVKRRSPFASWHYCRSLRDRFEGDFEAFLRRNYPTRYNNANLPYISLHGL